MKRPHNMILLFAVALAVPLTVACKGGSSESASSGGSVAVANVQQATFHVEGMTCTSCNVAVKVAAEKVEGVTEARASHGDKRAWVSFDPRRTNPEAIARTITAAGYEATPEAPSAAN